MTFAELLAQIGIPVESVTRVRLGRGVVGKVTWVFVVALVVLGVVASRLSNPYILAGIAGLVGLLCVLYLFKVMTFAKANPAAALLEGAELLQWQQLEMAGKGIPPVRRTIHGEPPKELGEGGN